MEEVLQKVVKCTTGQQVKNEKKTYKNLEKFRTKLIKHVGAVQKPQKKNSQEDLYKQFSNMAINASKEDLDSTSFKTNLAEHTAMQGEVPRIDPEMMKKGLSYPGLFSKKDLARVKQLYPFTPDDSKIIKTPTKESIAVIHALGSLMYPEDPEARMSFRKKGLAKVAETMLFVDNTCEKGYSAVHSEQNFDENGSFREGLQDLLNLAPTKNFHVLQAISDTFNVDLMVLQQEPEGMLARKFSPIVKKEGKHPPGVDICLFTVPKEIDDKQIEMHIGLVPKVTIRHSERREMVASPIKAGGRTKSEKKKETMAIQDQFRKATSNKNSIEEILAPFETKEMRAKERKLFLAAANLSVAVNKELNKVCTLTKRLNGEHVTLPLDVKKNIRDLVIKYEKELSPEKFQEIFPLEREINALKCIPYEKRDGYMDKVKTDENLCYRSSLGTGDCLFNAVSKQLTGKEDERMSDTLRISTAVALLNSSIPEKAAIDEIERGMFGAKWEAVVNAFTPCVHVSNLTACALSDALGIPIAMSQNLCGNEFHLTDGIDNFTCIPPQFDVNKPRLINIAWTFMGDNEKATRLYQHAAMDVKANHFVPVSHAHTPADALSDQHSYYEHCKELSNMCRLQEFKDLPTIPTRLNDANLAANRRFHTRNFRIGHILTDKNLMGMHKRLAYSLTYDVPLSERDASVKDLQKGSNWYKLVEGKLCQGERTSERKKNKEQEQSTIANVEPEKAKKNLNFDLMSPIKEEEDKKIPVITIGSAEKIKDVIGCGETEKSGSEDHAIAGEEMTKPAKKEQAIKEEKMEKPVVEEHGSEEEDMEDEEKIEEEEAEMDEEDMEEEGDVPMDVEEKKEADALLDKQPEEIVPHSSKSFNSPTKLMTRKRMAVPASEIEKYKHKAMLSPSKKTKLEDRISDSSSTSSRSIVSNTTQDSTSNIRKSRMTDLEKEAEKYHKEEDVDSSDDFAEEKSGFKKEKKLTKTKKLDFSYPDVKNGHLHDWTQYSKLPTGALRKPAGTKPFFMLTEAALLLQCKQNEEFVLNEPIPFSEQKEGTFYLFRDQEYGDSILKSYNEAKDNGSIGPWTEDLNKKKVLNRLFPPDGISYKGQNLLYKLRGEKTEKPKVTKMAFSSGHTTRFARDFVTDNRDFAYKKLGNEKKFIKGRIDPKKADYIEEVEIDENSMQILNKFSLDIKKSKEEQEKIKHLQKESYESVPQTSLMRRRVYHMITPCANKENVTSLFLVEYAGDLDAVKERYLDQDTEDMHTENKKVIIKPKHRAKGLKMGRAGEYQETVKVFNAIKTKRYHPLACKLSLGEEEFQVWATESKVARSSLVQLLKKEPTVLEIEAHRNDSGDGILLAASFRNPAFRLKDAPDKQSRQVLSISFINDVTQGQPEEIMNTLKLNLKMDAKAIKGALPDITQNLKLCMRNSPSIDTGCPEMGHLCKAIYDTFPGQIVLDTHSWKEDLIKGLENKASNISRREKDKLIRGFDKNKDNLLSANSMGTLDTELDALKDYFQCACDSPSWWKDEMKDMVDGMALQIRESNFAPQFTESKANELPLEMMGAIQKKINSYQDVKSNDSRIFGAVSKCLLDQEKEFLKGLTDDPDNKLELNAKVKGFPVRFHKMEDKTSEANLKEMRTYLARVNIDNLLPDLRSTESGLIHNVQPGKSNKPGHSKRTRTKK